MTAGWISTLELWRIAYRNRHQWAMDSRWTTGGGGKSFRYVRKAACRHTWTANDEGCFQVWKPIPGVFNETTDAIEFNIPPAVRS